MKYLEKKRLRQKALIKPLACVALAVSAMSIVPSALATWKPSPGSDIVWCVGDGDSINPYPQIPGFPGDALPFGPSTKDPSFGLNPVDTWENWMSYNNYLAELDGHPEKYSPLHNPPNLSDFLETDGPYSEPTLVNDRYATHINYWNSIVGSNTKYTSKTGYTAASQVPFGHSKGASCMSYAEYGNNHKSAFGFTVTYPATPSQPDDREIAFATDPAHLNDFPMSAPYADFDEVKNSDGTVVSRTYKGVKLTSGGPTNYFSTFKGCSWDANSCTAGSEIPLAGKDIKNDPDINAFPQKLSNVTSIPSTWVIGVDPYFGNPLEKDKAKQAWDASYDIWFDKTAHMAEGEAPYATKHDARGQNDGLEIMIWLNSNGSYVDSGYRSQRPAENQPGLIQPTGHIRERVRIAGVLWDVWVGRLNNPYFGYVTGNGVPPIIAPNEIAGNCPTSKGQGKNGVLCGVEWNVVSFVATKDATGNDKRTMSLDLDAKVFTNYILGIPDNRWYVLQEDVVPGSGYRTNVALQCPASNKDQSLSAPTTDCLKPDWYLMSVQAGFETWIGGNGLQSKQFTAYVNTKPAISAKGLINSKGSPIMNSTTPFNVVYPAARCASTLLPANNVAFTITGTNSAGANVTYPANGTKIDMGLPDSKTLQFNYAIRDSLSIRGDAVVHFTSACGNADVSAFIDSTGKAFYSDGKTPIAGAESTLLYSPSGSQFGPFVPVPNLNSGGVVHFGPFTNPPARIKTMGTPIMQINGNIHNPMITSSDGAFGWNAVPGWYKISTTFKGVTVTSAVQQVTANHPLDNVNATLPIAAPPSSLPTTPGVTVTLTLNGQDWAKGYCRNVILKNTNSYPVTWSVEFNLPFVGTIDPNNYWNLNYSQSGNFVTASGIGWNNVLQPGEQLNAGGFCASK